MGEKRIFLMAFWLKQFLICLHNIPKDAKIQKFWGMFSTCLDFLKVSFKIMISDL